MFSLSCFVADAHPDILTDGEEGFWSTEPYDPIRENNWLYPSQYDLRERSYGPLPYSSIAQVPLADYLPTYKW